jgi:peptidase M1-like protein
LYGFHVDDIIHSLLMRELDSVALVAFVCAVLAPAAAVAQSAATGTVTPPLSPRNANYTITARLDAASHTVTATETIRWRNITRTPAAELQFHLYWNAWRDNRSTYMRESALGAIRPNRTAADTPDSDRSWIDVTAFRLEDPSPIDLTAAQHFIAPDDGNPDDRTVVAVPLPQPIPPGATATVHVEWTAHVPRTFARTGVIGNSYFIAQWFPKLGVWQDEGWNCHQFHATTEFFSDYGSYDVAMTVPRGWLVGATGVERERRDNADATTTHRYYQDDVHDFAWTTSADYIERTARFERPMLPSVAMRLLLQPEHADQANRHFDATRITLRFYGEWYGAYPYDHLTIVDPAYRSGAGGMEYPTLFTAGTRWLAPRDATTPESVIVHEAGHQWWYGAVGNNEFEDAWLDEGLNQFSEGRALAAADVRNFLVIRYFGGFIPFVFHDVALSREADSNSLIGYRAVATHDSPATASYRYFPTSTGGITYAKTALWLNTLERTIGWPTLQRAMSTYFAAWKFRHPKPQDFFDTVSRAAGRDLTPFFDQVYRSSNAFDYGVDELAATREGDRHRSTVVVRRFGDAVFPVDVATIFTDGERVVEHWDGVDRWKAYVYERTVDARSVEVDPDHVLLLDVNWTNNSKTLEPRGRRAATKWSLTWLVWLQNCLLAWASLA